MCVVVMAMVGWMGAGMELVLGKHAGQSQVVGRMSADAGAFPEFLGNTLMTPNHTAIQLRSFFSVLLFFIITFRNRFSFIWRHDR